MNTVQRLGDGIRERDVSHGETVTVEWFVVDNRWRHRDPFEYEYEYRCTEYEYDSPDELGLLATVGIDHLEAMVGLIGVRKETMVEQANEDSTAGRVETRALSRWRVVS